MRMERGKRKAVAQFTNRQGLLILGIIAGIVMAVLLLWMLGYLPLETGCLRAWQAMTASI